MSLVEYSVHKLFIFIQYVVMLIPNLYHFITEIKWVSGNNSVLRKKPSIPEAPWVCIVSRVYNNIYSVFLLTVSYTVHKYTTHIPLCTWLCTFFFSACTGFLNLNHRHWICPCFKKKNEPLDSDACVQPFPPPVLANVQQARKMFSSKILL